MTIFVMRGDFQLMTGSAKVIQRGIHMRLP